MTPVITEDDMEVDNVEPEESSAWLLQHIPALPCFRYQIYPHLTKSNNFHDYPHHQNYHSFSDITLSLPSCFRTNSPSPLTHTEPKRQRKFLLRTSLNVNDYASSFPFLSWFNFASFIYSEACKILNGTL